jgi:RNA polymerase sigma-70 factor (ECF subfamily)
MFSILLRAPRWRIHQTASRAETDLLRRARLGEREATALLLGRHRDRIFRLSFQVLRDRETAEDATQEVFVRAFQRLPHFRGESEFSTWLHRLTLNYCLERRRVQVRRDDLLESLPPAEEATPSMTRQVETSQLLEIALSDLGEGLRVALILREWQGLSYEEIAEILHLPVGTVRSRLHEARRRFQAKWLELGGEEL